MHQFPIVRKAVLPLEQKPMFSSVLIILNNWSATEDIPQLFTKVPP